MRRYAALSALIFLAAAGVAQGDDDCMKCHVKGDGGAPAVKIDSASPHAESECSECHPGSRPPCGKTAKTLSCKTCHQDQAAALAGATHGSKLGKSPDAGTNDACLACHTDAPHSVRNAKDPSSPISRKNVSETCYACHKDNQAIAVGGYMNSIHHVDGETKATCVDCHGSHAIDHSKVAGSSTNRLVVPATCGRCHPEENERYKAGIHWEVAQKGFLEPPVCTDCHGEHDIRSHKDPASTTYSGNVTKTCAACHESALLISKFVMQKDRIGSFQDSFHGLSIKLGDLRVAHCASCHGAHDILPSKDPRSSTNPANLGKTCGGCHPGAAERFPIERVHISPTNPSHWLVALVRKIYIWLIVLTVGGMLIHNAFDLVFKTVHGPPWERRPGLSPRFSLSERIQHALLALSFIVLAVTGFALKFPDSPFGWPFQALSAGADLRRLSHRWAAVIFGVLTIYHILYLILTPRGRTQFRALWPRLSDTSDMIRVALLYANPRGRRPTLPTFTYVEKAEYWALAWGSVIMTVTGCILYFVNISLSQMPLWTVDLAATIHYMEALLACLTILVWHGYWVVFDPEIYPLNLTFLIGNPRPEGKAPAKK